MTTVLKNFGGSVEKIAKHIKNFKQIFNNIPAHKCSQQQYPQSPKTKNNSNVH